MNDVELTFKIAFQMESGEWDIVDEFTAASTDEANAYAEENYAGQEWYVLDANGNNTNA